MREYAISLLTVSAIFGLMALLSYRDDDKSIKLAFSLLLSAAILLPLGGVIEEFFSSELPELELPENMGDAEYIKVTKSAFEKGIMSALCSRFSLSEENISVECHGFDFEKMSCDKISVKLYGSAVFSDFDAAKKYLKENFGGCSVEIEVG